jgi:hypothetical protein
VTTAGNQLADLIRTEHSAPAIQPGGGPFAQIEGRTLKTWWA